LENITVGQIAAVVIFIAALITGGVKIKDSVKKWLENLLKAKFDEVNDKTDKLSLKIDKLEERLDSVDLENCKNYLVTFLSEVKRGEIKDEIEKQRFWEEFSHYTDRGGNSYIKRDVEELKKLGKI
jgi:hypothetical protein